MTNTISKGVESVFQVAPFEKAFSGGEMGGGAISNLNKV